MARRSITAPASAVGHARGLLWLAEVARDEGIEVTELRWSRDWSRHVVGVRGTGAVVRLAARLNLPLMGDGSWADGSWADLRVEVVVSR